MANQSEFRRGRTIAVGIGCGVGLVSLSVLVGWTFGITTLTQIVPGWPTMVPATAAAIALSSLGLVLLAQLRAQEGSTHAHGRIRSVIQVSAALAIVIGGLRLLELATHAAWNISHLGIPFISHAGTMAPATACGVLLLGTALLLSSASRAPRFVQVLCLLLLLAAWLGLTRYLYGGRPMLAFADMAIHTTLCLALLSIALLFVGDRVGLVRLLNSTTTGGTSARQLLPAAALVPLTLGWLPLLSTRAGWLGAEASVALFALAMVAVFGAMVWIHAMRLEQADQRRQEALDALYRSEERTRLIIEGALDAVVSIDGSGCIVGWNAQAQSIFGWQFADVVGKPLASTIIPERMIDAHLAGMQRYIETGVSRVLNRRVELSAMHRDGREFPIEIAITPIRTSSGMGFCAFIRDISERHAALAALHDSEQRFRTIAESLPHLVWTCRPDGWCDYLSRQWVEFTGSPESEQLGYGWAEHLHADDRERVRTEWAAATARGDHLDIEFRIRRHDGAYRWFKTRAVPIRDSSGTIVKWFGTNTDFEDYKVTQERLRSQIDRLNLLDKSTRAIAERKDLGSIFKSVLDNLETGLIIDFGCICTFDPQRRELMVSCIGDASHYYVDALELREGTRIPVDSHGLAQSVSGALVHQPDLASDAAPFSTRLREAGLKTLVIAPLSVEDRIFGVLVAARSEAHGFSSGDCEFLRQLSAHVALAAQQAELFSSLHAAYDDLRQSQQAALRHERLRAVGQMASGIAHDINNALSPAALYVQSILERDAGFDDAVKAKLQVIESSIGSVSATIGRLRDFYRDREPQQLPEPVQVSEAAEQAIEITRARWHDIPQQRGIVIELVKELDDSLPAIAGNQSELRDAVVNLILNAVDAMPHGGKLTVSTCLAAPEDARSGGGQELAITVSDTGVGMSAETRDRCLEPFFSTKGERGTGLGLAMVYGMVERSQGRILIESEPGQGTRIRMLFPLSRSAAPVEATMPVVKPPPMRLLVVDDDPVLRKSLEDILSFDGHTVVVADGGQAGIDALARMEQQGELCSIVITDLGMPHVDGSKVAAAAKAGARKLPVILLTGWGRRLLDDNEIPPNVDRVLCKPPKLAELRAAIAELALPAASRPER